MKKLKEITKRIVTLGLAAALMINSLPATAFAAGENEKTDGDTAVAETDGFSLYTVEFTYESKQYVLPGDSEITLSEILDTVGLAGEVTDVKVSDENLFSASDESGEWIVTAHKAFDTEEWMKVTIGGVVYEITVTDTNGEQSVTYTISHVTENGRYIYSLKGSDGSSNVLLDAKGARPNKVSLEMGDDITFVVDAGGNVFTCNHETKPDDINMLGFSDYLNTNNYDFTITSKTRIIKHVQIDGKGYKSAKKIKSSMEADGSDKTITVHWEGGGQNSTRMGAPGKFIVTFAPPAQTYRISYVLNGGTNASGNPSTYADNVGVSSFADPTREHYTFGGWYDNANCTGTSVTGIPAGSSGDKKLYAKWTPIKYTITWKDGNGKTIKTDQVNYGVTPYYNGATPTKKATAQYSYTFTGWSPTVRSVLRDQTYTAQFSSTIREYDVTWKHSDGTTIKTDTIEYGKTPSYSGATPTKASDGKYSYTFKGWSPSITRVTGDATYTAAYTKTPIATHFSQSGDTYTIHDAVGWEIFCECLQDNETYNSFSGKKVVLGDNISVTGMAGSSDNHFCGTFDGKGKTLTVRYDAGEDYAAPFRYADDGCVIENLHVDGAIATSSQFAAGVIGEQYGTVTICNCRVSVTIKSSTSGDGTHGGFVGIKGDNARLTIEGCVFDGRIVSAGSTATTDCGGYVGWTKSSGSLIITNSLYAPAADADAVSTGATFARNWTMPNNANCYYTAAFDFEQGKQAYSITAGENTTVANAGTAKAYDVSGITSYGTGIRYNDVLYAGAGEAVSLTLGNTPPSGKEFGGYCVTNASGEDITGSALDGTTLTMPAGNVTVSAVFKTLHTHSFTYSASGATITATCANTDGNCPLTEHKAILTIVKPAKTTYGDEQSAEATLTGDTGTLGEPAIIYVGSGSTTYAESSTAPTNAGTYTASFSLGGKTARVSYTIDRKNVTITGLGAEGKEYDGTTTATVTGKATAAVFGKVDGDDVSVDTSAGRAAFEDANAGTDKQVTFSGYSLSGTAAGNYTLSAQPAAVTADITPKSITGATVTLSAAQKEYTGSEQSVSVTGVTLDGKTLTADDYEVTGDTSGTVKDTYTVTVSGKGNYKDSATAAWEITNIRAKVTTAPKAESDLKYTGSSQELVTAGEATGGKMQYAIGTNATDEPTSGWSTSIPKETNAGTYYVWYKVKGEGNYKDSPSASVETRISKVNDPAVVNNKSTVNTGGKTIKLSDLVDGAKGNVSFEFANESEKHGCSINGDTFTSGDEAAEVKVKVNIGDSSNYIGRGTDTIVISVVKSVDDDPTSTPSENEVDDPTTTPSENEVDNPTPTPGDNEAEQPAEPTTPEQPAVVRNTVAIEGIEGVFASYSSQITFIGKKASFTSDDVKLYTEDGSQIIFKKAKIKNANKPGTTYFKVKGVQLADKKVKKAIQKTKFPITIVAYEVTEKDVVTIKTNSKGNVKSVTVNGIKLKKSEYSGDATALTFSGRFSGSWKKS